MRKRAIVIGGSIGGLFAGLLLRRIGWDVSIHERAGEELGARGAGIVTHDELHEALTLATGHSEPIGVSVSGRVVLDRDGSVVCEASRPQVLASWDRVWQRLRACTGGIYHHGHTLVSVEQPGNTVVANFAGGEQIDADLLIAADGIQSTVRKQLFPQSQPQYVGYIAWRGLVDESELSPQARDRLFDRFGFCLPPHEQMLGYPVDGIDRDGKATCRYNYVWYRPAHPEFDLPRLLKGSDGQQYADAIPPNRLHPDVVDDMRQAAERLLAPPFAEVVRRTKTPLLQPIVDLETPSMIQGRIALMGDAAFVARPHVGAGVTKAAGDARALADLLSQHDDVDIALTAYQKQRHAYGQRIIRRTRHLGAYMQSQLLSDEQRALAEKHRSPRAVMDETATMQDMETW